MTQSVAPAGHLDLDDLLCEEAIDRPVSYYGRLRAVSPVYWNERWNGWIVTGYPAVVAGFRDHQRLSSDRFAGPFGDELRRSAAASGTEQLLGFLSKFFVWKDQPYHTRVRSLVNKAFTPRSVEKLRPRIADLVPAGQQALAAGEKVSVDRLRRHLDNVEVALEPGDALLIRTGWLAAWRRGGTSPSTWPGLDLDCVDFLADSDVTLVGADNPGVEVLPSSDPECQIPLHVALVRGRGIYFSELLDLDELAGADQATFLFVLSPVPFVGAVGGPVCPVAVI
jgi:hypothetical protein